MASQILKISAVDGRKHGDTVMAQYQGEADVNKQEVKFDKCTRNGVPGRGGGCESD